MKNEYNNEEPMFYTGPEDTSGEKSEELSPFYQGFDKEYKELPPEKPPESKYVLDSEPSGEKKTMAVLCISAAVVFSCLVIFFSLYRRQGMFEPIINIVYLSLIPVAFAAIIIGYSAFRYRRNVKNGKQNVIDPVKRFAPGLKPGIAFCILLGLCVACCIYLFTQQDRFVIWIAAALLAAAGGVVVFGFPLRLIYKIIVIPLVVLLFNQIMTFRIVPLDNYTVHYYYISQDGYEEGMSSGENDFFEGSMSYDDFLTSMAYINEKGYLEQNQKNTYSFSDSGTKERFYSFFKNPGYYVMKTHEGHSGAEKRFMTLVFPLKDKNDRVRVTELATSTLLSFSAYSVKTEQHRGEYPVSLYFETPTGTMSHEDYDKIVSNNNIKAYCIIAVDSYWESSPENNAKKLLVLDDDNVGKDYINLLDDNNVLVSYAYQDCRCEYRVDYE